MEKNKQPIEQTTTKEEAPVNSLARHIANSNCKVVFGLQPDQIKLIDEYALKYGGYNHHVFRDVAKEISWEPLTLACYYFEQKQYPQSDVSVEEVAEKWAVDYFGEDESGGEISTYAKNAFIAGHTHAANSKQLVRMEDVLAIIENHKIPKWASNEVVEGYYYAKNEFLTHIKTLTNNGKDR